jgi:hypothetical protein
LQTQLPATQVWPIAQPCSQGVEAAPVVPPTRLAPPQTTRQTPSRQQLCPVAQSRLLAQENSSWGSGLTNWQPLAASNPRGSQRHPVLGAPFILQLELPLGCVRASAWVAHSIDPVRCRPSHALSATEAIRAKTVDYRDLSSP